MQQNLVARYKDNKRMILNENKESGLTSGARGIDSGGRRTKRKIKAKQYREIIIYAQKPSKYNSFSLDYFLLYSEQLPHHNDIFYSCAAAAAAVGFGICAKV